MSDAVVTEAIGLGPEVRACLFDLDGVLTSTAETHAAAWKQAFDQVLAAQSPAEGVDLRPFDPVDDYLEFVDGRPRLDGVRSFLASRHLVLPEHDGDVGPTVTSVFGIGELKNELFHRELAAGGVLVYPDARRYLETVAAANVPIAVVSSSANARVVLTSTGLGSYADQVVDGLVMVERGLPGKPDPAAYLLAAELLGVPPANAAVFEDALVGVEAARNGGFRAVIGVDRVDHADELRRAGATMVVNELTQLLG